MPKQKKNAEIHSVGSLAKRFGKTLTKPPHGLRRMEQREAKPFLACNMPCLETDCGLGSRNLTVTSLLRNDRHMPLAYSKSVKKGVEKTLEEVKQGKAEKYFGENLNIPYSEVPPVIHPIEILHHFEWRDITQYVNFDAKKISATAWRHFRLSWFDYMNMVILASPLRRDRLVLEKIKILGPPRSINIIRKTFGMGDSRSRRLFFQIFYTPRIAELNGVKLPSTLRLLFTGSMHMPILNSVIAKHTIHENLLHGYMCDCVGPYMMGRKNIIDLTGVSHAVKIASVNLSPKTVAANTSLGPTNPTSTVSGKMKKYIDRAKIINGIKQNENT